MRSLSIILFLSWVAIPPLVGQDLQFLPDAPTPRTDARYSARAEAKLDRALSIVAWPGYVTVARDRSRLGVAEKRVLAAERLAFSFDLATTVAVIDANSPLVERNPMNSLWGNRNRVGIVSSMTGWEMGYSYAAAVVPRLPWTGRWRKPVKVASILLGGLLIEEHVRTGVCNLRLAGKATITPADNCSLF